MAAILIADDHEVVCNGLRDLLGAQPGWSICGETGSGREAIAIARSRRPDAAVLDMSMPDLNGIDTARELRRASPTTEVVLFTMHHSEDLAREAFGAGVLGYVLKSDPARAVVEAVRAALAHVRFVSPRLAALRPGALRRTAPAALPDTTRLTPREREIVQLLAEGKSNGAIAQLLGLSTKTVENHRFNVMQKLAMTSVVELVRYAVRNRLVPM